MQHPKSISELLQGAHKRLDDLSARLVAREGVREVVRAQLPQDLAAEVHSAGFERGELSVGTSRAAFATRLRYALAERRAPLAAALEAEIVSIRVRIVAPRV
ncbi:MAG: DUF721 domain-containing protein [Gammaproteobacteria bacterium]|nr:DUF721 domain-containing protein [Gammaproteobacteria bacterium]